MQVESPGEGNGTEGRLNSTQSCSIVVSLSLHVFGLAPTSLSLTLELECLKSDGRHLAESRGSWRLWAKLRTRPSFSEFSYKTCEFTLRVVNGIFYLCTMGQNSIMTVMSYENVPESKSKTRGSVLVF